MSSFKVSHEHIIFLPVYRHAHVHVTQINDKASSYRKQNG